MGSTWKYSWNNLAGREKKRFRTKALFHFMLFRRFDAVDLGEELADGAFHPAFQRDR